MPTPTYFKRQTRKKSLEPVDIILSKFVATGDKKYLSEAIKSLENLQRARP